MLLAKNRFNAPLHSFYDNSREVCGSPAIPSDEINQIGFPGVANLPDLDIYLPRYLGKLFST